MTYLLSLSIGPVQDMISAARRTKDLWYGSTILSEISKSAAAWLLQQGHQLVFPYSRKLSADLSPGSPFKVVNHILAIAETSDPKKLLEDTKKAAQNRLLEIANSATRDLARKNLCTYDRNVFDSQLAHLLEFYAAWQPHPNPSDYEKDREKLEALVASRKVLKNFAPHNGLALEKSSLDGIRETVLPLPKDRNPSFFIGEREELDALGLIKRFGGPRRQSRFDSTTDIAARPYVTYLKRRHPDLYKQYEDLTKKLESNNIAPATDSYLYPHESRQLKELEHLPLVSQLKTLTESIRQRKAPLPPYYAVLVGDGDFMGKALSELNDPEAHRKFSAFLSEFATQANQLIEQKYDGEAVFAGGDDIVAFLPLHTALDAALALRNAFTGRFESLTTFKPTFSAGLAIIHAIDPLTEALATARRAEKLAKNIAFGHPKDALCIIHSPRSGADITALGHWEKIIPNLQNIVAAYNQFKLSRSFAYDLRSFLLRSKRLGLDLDIGHALSDLARSMAERKQDNPALLLQLISTYCPPAQDSNEHFAALMRLTQDLMIAHPFARSTREAGQP